MTRLLPPTPIEELVRTANPNLASYTLVANLNLTYHTRTTSWPLTSYTHAMTRFLPPTPIEELVLAAHPNPTSYTHAMTRLSPSLLLRPDLRLPSSYARATTRLLTPTPIKEPVLAAHPNLTSRRRHPSRRPIPQRRPHLLLRPSSLPLPLMRLRAPQITSRRLLLPRPTIPQRRTRPLPRRRPPPLLLPFMFLRALKTAPWPLPPPLAWLWMPPTESRRRPLPLVSMSAVGTNTDGPTADAAWRNRCLHLFFGRLHLCVNYAPFCIYWPTYHTIAFINRVTSVTLVLIGLTGLFTEMVRQWDHHHTSYEFVYSISATENVKYYRKIYIPSVGADETSWRNETRV